MGFGFTGLDFKGKSSKGSRVRVEGVLGFAPLGVVFTGFGLGLEALRVMVRVQAVRTCAFRFRGDA